MFSRTSQTFSLTAVTSLLGLGVALAGCNATNSTIVWTPCEAELMIGATTELLCANITVPLDYTDPGSGTLHTLELVKSPARQKPSRGSLLLNYGGPGVDGRKNIAATAALYHEITGGEHDLITWDPRGTARSFLRFSCYKSAADRLLATSPDPLILQLDDNEHAATRHFAQAKAIADLCAANLQDVGSYIGTAFTARDAMSIVDALGQGPFINYFGISYGTALGTTIAAMFPERIKSMVLDGVLNPHEYWNSYADISMIADADKAFRAMLSECLAAGPERCVLARRATTAEELEAKIIEFTEGLKVDPIPLPAHMFDHSSIAAGTLLDYSALKTILHGSLYNPVYFAGLVLFLDGLMSGDLSLVSAFREVLNAILRDTPEAESLMGIRCSDKSLRASKFSDIAPVLEEGRKAGWVGGTGQIFGQIALPCSQWQFDAKERYTGDFRVKTKNPIFFISSTYDPVTPLVSAYNASEAFEGSVVVERKGFGHCSFSQRSATAERAMKEYFQHGVLPKAGTQYEPNAPVFSG
ncbi:putative hydrolase [Paramyrothecium foliicola]|nr:putative hydrolase [Paramyrothecium foliicola]